MASLKYNEMPLSGWGGIEAHTAHVYRPARRQELRDALAGDAAAGVIARGLGRSYGDSATLDGGKVVLGTRLNRMLGFDAVRGLLTCESGVSFADVIETFVPRGYFLPVSPGTKFITVGGAIAADIHGKNHHVVGSFGNFVESIEVWTGNDELVRASREENAELFWATIGGMGLTGYIVTATFRLLPIESSLMRVNYRRVANLTELLQLVMAGGASPTYSVAWIDCVARDEKMGRAVLIEAEHARRAELTGAKAASPLELPRPRKLSVPCNFPGFALNSWSVGLFNALYYRMHPTRSDAFTSYEPFFYPLDGINNWNRIYGKRGFIQYQALLPLETSAEGIPKVLGEIVRSRLASFLAVLKRTGDANPGLLSFCKSGITLALDLPNAGTSLRELTSRLDQLLLEYGGRLYLAKDSVTTADVIAKMYPQLDRFRGVKAQVDPRGKFTSAQAKRLGIVA